MMKSYLRYFFVLILLISLLTVIAFQNNTVDDPATVESKILLKTSESWDGEPIYYPEGDAEVTAVLIKIPAGAETGWHYHPIPSFAYMIEGELVITLKDGKTKKLEQGEALAEVSNTIHSGKNTGDVTANLVVFYAGSKGDTLTIITGESDQ